MNPLILYYVLSMPLGADHFMGFVDHVRVKTEADAAQHDDDRSTAYAVVL